MIDVDGVRLCADTAGRADDPPVLLIGGAAASMDWWDDALVTALADGGRFVIRYDHRDTGESVCYPAGAPGYRADDLAHDALRVLDGLGLAAAHLVGISMGGMLAQSLAITHPDRVLSLTLIATSPGPGDPDLPLPALGAVAASTPDWSDPRAAADHLVAAQRVLANRAATPDAGAAGFDEARARALAERVVARTTSMAASETNHYVAEGGEAIRDRLPGITAPTLVVHGSADPLFPVGHGEALAREIPGATLLTLPGIGHETPPPETWPVVVPAILRHTTGG